MERDHLKGASVDAINVSQGGRHYLPNGINLTPPSTTTTTRAGSPSLNTRPRGPVNLLTAGHAKTGRFPLALRGDARFGDLAPHDDRPGTKRPIAR